LAELVQITGPALAEQNYQERARPSGVTRLRKGHRSSPAAYDRFYYPITIFT
jgi:hypothetical protein